MSISKYKANNESGSDFNKNFNKIVKKGKMYTVRGHKTPDSALAQQLANDKKLDGRIIDFGIDETKCFVHTKAVAPNGQELEDVMVYEWQTLKEICLLDMIEKAIKDNEMDKLIESNDKDGKPILFSDKNYELYKRFIKLKHFAIRDLATKSYRRAYLKLLNKEWVESEEEDELEQMEQRTVEDSINPPKNINDMDNRPDFSEDEIQEMYNKGQKETLDSIEDSGNYILRKYLEDNSKNLLFPKRNLQQFNEICKIIDNDNKDYLRFYILDTKFRGLDVTNKEFGDNNIYWQIRVIYPQDKENPFSLVFHKIFGDLRPSKSTKTNYSDKDLNYFLNEIAFGENVFIAPQSLYKGFKALQDKISNNN